MLGALALLAVTAAPVSADKCTGAKLKAIGKKESGLLACHAKVAAKGDATLLAGCVLKVKAKYAIAFAKAGTCSGVEADCESIADDCGDQVRAALPDAGPSKCEAARLKAAGKKATSLLACYAKDDPTTVSACQAKADVKFQAMYTKVTGCGGDGQAASVEALIDDECASQLVTLDGSGNVTGLCPVPSCPPNMAAIVCVCTNPAVICRLPCNGVPANSACANARSYCAGACTIDGGGPGNCGAALCTRCDNGSPCQ